MFASAGGVTRHLSQLLSACALYHHLLVAPLQLPILAQTPFDNMDVQTEMFDQEGCNQMDATEPGENVFMEPMDVNPGPAATDPAQSHVCEDYPNLLDAYPSDGTFMSQFCQDPHAVHQTKNLCYPFTSQGEWQLGFFLISCRMSMNLINQFLNWFILPFILLFS